MFFLRCRPATAPARNAISAQGIHTTVLPARAAFLLPWKLVLRGMRHHSSVHDCHADSSHAPDIVFTFRIQRRLRGTRPDIGRLVLPRSPVRASHWLGRTKRSSRIFRVNVIGRNSPQPAYAATFPTATRLTGPTSKEGSEFVSGNNRSSKFLSGNQGRITGFQENRRGYEK